MKYWKNQPQSLGQSSTPSAGLMAASNMPKIELPEVGDTILLTIHNFGGVSVIDPDNEVIGGNLDVVEVEVKAVKKTKTIIE